MAKKLCRCGKPSLPGLIKKVALCQYHYDVHMWGKEWADKIAKGEPCIPQEESK